MRITALWLVGLVVTIVSTNARGAEQEPSNADVFAVVRVTHPVLVESVLSGHERSATFRELVQDIRESGWLVFISGGKCPSPVIVACLLHVVGNYEGAPVMRVIVDADRPPTDAVIVTIAHELQHAREVAQSPPIRTAAAMHQLFRQIGRISSRGPGGPVYETVAAELVAAQVQRDLHRSRRRSR